MRTNARSHLRSEGIRSWNSGLPLLEKLDMKIRMLFLEIDASVAHIG